MPSIVVCVETDEVRVEDAKEDLASDREDPVCRG